MYISTFDAYLYSSKLGLPASVLAANSAQPGVRHGEARSVDKAISIRIYIYLSYMYIYVYMYIDL